MYLYTRNVCLGYKNDVQYIYFFINKLYINLTVRKNMIIRTAFSFYEPRLSYTISRILKSVPTWGWITNHSGLMKSEWDLDADVLSRIGRAKWGVNPHATNNQSRIKMAVNCLPSLGPSALSRIDRCPAGNTKQEESLLWDLEWVVPRILISDISPLINRFPATTDGIPVMLPHVYLDLMLISKH